jgi:hypothetical protein
MKQILKIIVPVVFTVFIISGCDKNSFNLKDNIFINGKASLKVNFFSSYQANPVYHIKIDDVRVSNNLTYATPFPGGGLNTGGGNYADYLAVDPGMRKITIARPFTGTNNDSIVLATATVDVQANKTYSLYFADTSSNTFTLLAEDELSSPDSGFIKYRFINLMPDLPAGFDLYFGTGATSTTSTKVAGPILYKQMSNYFTVPLNTGTVWSIRAGGDAATTTALVTYTSASSVINQRVFSISTRGYNSITSTADPRRRLFSFIYNR